MSERLRDLRWRRGLPLHLLAQRAGVSAGELLMWEQHGVQHPRDILQRVAQILGVEPRDLIREG